MGKIKNQLINGINADIRERVSYLWDVVNNFDDDIHSITDEDIKEVEDIVQNLKILISDRNKIKDIDEKTLRKAILGK